MKNKKGLFLAKCAVSLFVLINLTHIAYSQKSDSTEVTSHFGGSVTVTNNGTSTIPNLSLGKPAAIFSLSMGRRIRFEPEFRFALEGKPWSFIFWWRYDVLNTDRFLIRTGANTSINFKSISATTDEFSDDIIWARRSLTGDLSASYLLTKNISIGPYFMYIHGFEKYASRNRLLLAFRTSFSNVTLSKQFFLRFNPQVYYLKIDKDDGFYFNGVLTLAKQNFPLSVSTLINKAIRTEIPAGKNFIWNVSLTYTFANDYVKK